jgi:PGF-CTERM protein
VELFDEYADIFDNAINSFVIEYPAPVTTPSPSPSPSPEEGVPGFEAVSAIAGLLAVVYLLRRRG